MEGTGAGKVIVYRDWKASPEEGAGAQERSELSLPGTQFCRQEILINSLQQVFIEELVCEKFLITLKPSTHTHRLSLWKFVCTYTKVRSKAGKGQV